MKILFGSIVVDARGRLNGHVFKKTAFGNSITALALPRNRSQWQQNTALPRNTAIMQGWNKLTPLQKSQWQAFAVANPLPNAFGVLRTINAKAMFTRCTNLYAFPAIGTVPVDVASNINPPTEVIPLGVDGETGRISWETTLLTDTFQLVIYVQQVPSGNGVPRGNKWRRIDNLVINSLGITTGAKNIFDTVGIPRSGFRYFVKYRVINSTGWGRAEFQIPLAVD